MTLADRIRQRIELEGPIPFEEFQTLALYDPDGGFFSSPVLRSTRDGDFLTSPEVSPLFGATLARFVASERERLGCPSRFAVVEVAAGSGSLLRPLLDGLEGDLEVWAVEVSQAARAALGDIGGVTVVADLADIPGDITGVVLANELIDNIPVALAVWEGDKWSERFVATDREGFLLVTATARPEVARWADAYGGRVPPGGMVEVQLEAAHWVSSTLQRIKRGALVVIDYGDTAEGLEPRRTQGTLRTYRAHHLGPDPLLSPGETDITVDVNFTALVAVAQEAGADVEYHRQDDFLALLGLRQELSVLRHEELALATAGDPMERLRVRSIRSEAETLLHPRGLGDFRVMVARS